MYMSDYKMSAAASQIRGISTTLDTLVADLHAAGVWTGTDADRFQQEWGDQVSSLLQSAATKLDNIQFKPSGE